MKAAVLAGVRHMEVQDVPDPQLERDTDVLLRVAMVGICGSDVHYYRWGRIGSQEVRYPWTIGHECAATVVEVGSGVQGLKEGDRVAVDPLIWCGRCDQCASGRENTCRDQRFLGNPGEASGAMAEYLVMPAASCYVLPDSLSFVAGALIEPLAIGEHARCLSGVQPGSTVAILGSGPIGLSVLAALEAAGPQQAYVTDLIDDRLAMARRYGADWTGSPQNCDVVAEITGRWPDGVDAVFECAGKQETIDQAISLLTPGGVLMIIGITDEQRISFNFDVARRLEHRIQMVRRQNHTTAAAIELVAAGKVDVEPMATHHGSLADAPRLLETVGEYEDGVVKAILHLAD